MPLDICLVTIDSNAVWYNIPLRIMRGSKKNDMIGDSLRQYQIGHGYMNSMNLK